MRDACLKLLVIMRSLLETTDFGSLWSIITSLVNKLAIDEVEKGVSVGATV